MKILENRINPLNNSASRLSEINLEEKSQIHLFIAYTHCINLIIIGGINN